MVATFNSIAELKGFPRVVSLHLIAALGVQWRLTAFQHGKCSLMCKSRWFKSSRLPKAVVTPLPCPASSVPAAVLPTSPSASMAFSWLHSELGCGGKATAGRSTQFSPRAECRSSQAVAPRQCKGRRGARIGTSSWEGTERRSAFLAVAKVYDRLNCTWNSRHR